MMLSALVVAALLAPKPPVRSEPVLTVSVDSVHHRVIVSAGPFDLPNMPADMAEMHHGSPQVFRFRWPVTGGMQGFDVEMRDAAGNPLPREIVHHLIGVNFDRRQLVYHAVERLFGWGSETDPVMLPNGVAVPLEQGEHLGVYTMWHNDTGKDITGAYLRVILPYIPGKKYIPVFPLYVDVNNVIGGVTTFDIPPGKSTRSYEFEFPISGKLIGVGGHLHDYGVAVSLQDAQTGKTLVRLKAQRDKDGHVSHVGRFIWGFHDSAMPIEAHHKYRVVAEYDNQSGETITAGAMGHINGAFSPDDPSEWPKLDRNDPAVQRDIAALPSAGTDMRMSSGRSHRDEGPHASMNHSGMSHSGMEHMQMDRSTSAGLDGSNVHRAAKPDVLPPDSAAKRDTTSNP